MKKSKYKCVICQDTGYFTNPFDQTYSCACKKKKRKHNKKPSEKVETRGTMTLDEAQKVAERMANLNSLDITLLEIRQALVLLGNFYEDNKENLNK